jgi:hypothetical protein
MLRGHIAHRPSAQWQATRPLLINAGATRPYVRLGPMAYVMGRKQWAFAYVGSGEQGLYTCQHRTPAYPKVLLSLEPCRGLDLYVYRGPVALYGGPALLRHGAFPRHVAPFGPPIQWS